MKNYAHSYSEAIYSLAEDNKDKILSDLSLVSELVLENETYTKIMDAPDIDFKEKEKLLDEAFSESVHEYVLNLLKLLSKNHLFSHIFKIRDEYEKSYNKEFNIEKAEVITSGPISEALKEKIIKKLSDMTKKTIKAQFREDKSIIGGVVIKTENSILDASFKQELNKIRKAIS